MKDLQDNHDGYHTFRELYECRHALFAYMVNSGAPQFRKCKKNSDGTSCEGWFLVSGNLAGRQISFHIPDRLWDLFKCDESLGPLSWDGHNTEDVIDRIKDLSGIFITKRQERFQYLFRKRQLCYLTDEESNEYMSYFGE